MLLNAAITRVPNSTSRPIPILVLLVLLLLDAAITSAAASGAHLAGSLALTRLTGRAAVHLIALDTGS
jgi:hypothetical protein